MSWKPSAFKSARYCDQRFTEAKDALRYHLVLRSVQAAEDERTAPRMAKVFAGVRRGGRAQAGGQVTALLEQYQVVQESIPIQRAAGCCSSEGTLREYEASYL